MVTEELLKGLFQKPKMEVKARASFIRSSPRKLRLVASVIKEFSLDEALTFLENSPKRASLPLLRVVKQAVANATKNLGLEKESLKLKKIEIGEGPTYKRWRAVSRGRAHGIQKRTSHITVVLEGEKAAGRKVARARKPARKKEENQKEKKKGVKNGTKG